MVKVAFYYQMFKLLAFSHQSIKTQLIFNKKCIKSQFYPWSVKDDFTLKKKEETTKDDLITKLPPQSSRYIQVTTTFVLIKVGCYYLFKPF